MLTQHNILYQTSKRKSKTAFSNLAAIYSMHQACIQNVTQKNSQSSILEILGCQKSDTPVFSIAIVADTQYFKVKIPITKRC